VLVGDIDRGGVIASLVGTKTVIDAVDAALIRGFLVNKFRGDPALFAAGMATIAEATGWEALGLIPFFPDARALPAEDALALDHARAPKSNPRVRVVVPLLPHIANFDDLDPLDAEPAVDLLRVRPPAALPGDADLVILPGSKSTIADLAALRAAGFHIDIAAHHRRGGLVLGLCGGYQMLGKSVADPDGIEGPPGETPGLGLLDVTTMMTPNKSLTRIKARHAETKQPIEAYEIHIGQTEGSDRSRPFAVVDGAPEGAISADGRVQGSYLHGLFSSDAFRSAYLARLGVNASNEGYRGRVEGALDALAAHIERHLDVEGLLALAR
jgi:adenosylcobyric acid synthase